MANAVYALTNKYGATIPTCTRHEAKHRKCVYGDLWQVPTDKACPLCEQEIARILQPWKVFQALTSKNFSHSRVHSLALTSVQIYHYDRTSPTGVKHVAGYDAKKFDAMFEACRTAGLVRSSASPLSPTEKR